MKTYFLTTPLYYVNAKPHIGHAYTTIAADVLARFKRLKGHPVFFLTGTDEHGQKVQQASIEEGVSPEVFTQRLSDSFRELWEILLISYDDFIRTTEPRHTHAVRRVWEILQEKGHLYIDNYEGWYDTTSESFFTDEASAREASRESGKPIEKIQEKNYFFRISSFQPWLIEWIEKNPSFIEPETRRNETLSFLKNNKLSDLCISRPHKRLSWGIPCPLSDDHVTYVWFDALINYISACGFPEDHKRLNSLWPCQVHLIGKDILRPHTVYWPIMLHAIGLPMPERVFAHGWWMQGNAKMSKSLGNAIKPLEVIKRYGIDAFRYFLMREVPFGQDGKYSDEAMCLRYNTDLANDLGNLLFRTLSMLEKYFDGIIPVKDVKETSSPLSELAKSLPDDMENKLDQLKFHEALTLLWDYVGAGNKFIENQSPWRLNKEKKFMELKQTLQHLCEALRLIAQLVMPVMPLAAKSIWLQLGLPEKELSLPLTMTKHWNYFKQDTQTKKTAPIFPRREKI